MRTCITAAGDLLMLRRVSHDAEGMEQCREFIEKGDARFANFETIVCREGEFFGGAFCGGSNHRVDPEALDDVRSYGFNMLSFANNHTFDYSYNGLLNTLKHIEDKGFVNAGVGRNLDEAAAPRYLETKNGRIALISAVSSMADVSAMAGRQSRRVPGRPGVNGLRIDETISVTPDQFKVLKEIVVQSNVNAAERIAISEGYILPPPDGIIKIKDVRFKEGKTTSHMTHVNDEDMQRVLKAIYEAKHNADIVLISVHSHETAGFTKETPADFLIEFSHKCIDNGADAILGHGPHILRPLEIYKGKPIFYSLGNFNMYNESLTVSPEDILTKYGLNSDCTMTDFYKTRSAGFTRGIMNDRRSHESVVASLVFEDGKLSEVELLPIEMGFDYPKRWQHGTPKPCFDKGILQRLEKMSEEYGIEIKIDSRGIGHVVL